MAGITKQPVTLELGSKGSSWGYWKEGQGSLEKLLTKAYFRKVPGAWKVPWIKGISIPKTRLKRTY